MTKRQVSSLDELPSARAYFRRIGAEIRSFRTAVVREHRGKYWTDIATITVARNGVIQAPVQYAPTKEEAEAIKDECETVTFPYIKRLSSIVNPPDIVKTAENKDIYEFRDQDDLIVMLQVRVDLKDGNKKYVPVTFWSDDVWRLLEPEGPLPLYNMHKVKDCYTVFVHEGAKAARAVTEMIEARTPEMRAKLGAHPWGIELGGAVHVGWIGGALSPMRTDWNALMELGVKRVYIVADNDEPGFTSVPKISKQLKLPCFHVQFTKDWPEGFDLADPFPKSMFAELDGQIHYVGPTFRNCLQPATWATDRVSPGVDDKGKPKPEVTVIRDIFAQQWAYIDKPNLFVCKDLPENLLNEETANNLLMAFAHTQNVTKLLLKSYKGRTTRLTYRPDVSERVIMDNGMPSINLHIPGEIKPIVGNAQPWLDYMHYMFPDEKECYQVLRWIATLVGCPSVRMQFGLLLVSEKQGIGKTTLGSAILSPLLGNNNVGWPSENDIATSVFNSWLANKRLVFVNEIYSGHSWKAYHNLKSIITDTQITVNEKHQKAYVIDSWCHIIACSNSLRALKMDQSDRRWFYPKVTEVPWSKQRFKEFRGWLASGGLGIIRWWADEFGDYVASGENPMFTKRKHELIENSRSEGCAEAAVLGESMNSYPEPLALTMQSVTTHIRQHAQGKVYDSDVDIRRAMQDRGCFVSEERLKVDGRMQPVIFNIAAKKLIDEKVEGLVDETILRVYKELLRGFIKPTQTLFESTM